MTETINFVISILFCFVVLYIGHCLYRKYIFTNLIHVTIKTTRNIMATVLEKTLIFYRIFIAIKTEFLGIFLRM
jgi:hypothetical protein